MSQNLQMDPFSRTNVEPELAGFLNSLREKIQQISGNNPTVEMLRHASRAARIGRSLAGPDVRIISAPDFGLPSRLYRPVVSDQSPLLIYLHGGGWTLLDLDTHDRMMRAYALESGWSVLGLDYPLAPETKFPQNLFACADAVGCVIKNAVAMGVDPDCIVLGGDSSGANLALAIELHRCAAGHTPLAGLLLNYGVFDCDFTRPSYEQFGKPPYLLTTERMEYFWNNYCTTVTDRADPRASPLRTEPDLLGKLPSVHLTIAALDILVDENLLLAKMLQTAGVNITSKVYEKATHGFLEAVHCSGVANQAIADTASWLTDLSS